MPRPSCIAGMRWSFDVQECPILIAHALGGIDGVTYSNTKEAFRHNLAQGKTVFEGDVSITTDGVLVMFHDGSGRDLHTGEAKEQSSEQFLSKRIKGGLAPITLDQFLSELLLHSRAYFVTDVKLREHELFSGIQQAAQSMDAQLMRRIIPQAYNEKDIRVLEDLGFSRIILTLYKRNLPDAELLALVREYPSLVAITMPTDRFSPDVGDVLRKEGVQTFVHTVNDPEKISQLVNDGVTGVYTDFYVPAPR